VGSGAVGVVFVRARLGGVPGMQPVHQVNRGGLGDAQSGARGTSRAEAGTRGSRSGSLRRSRGRPGLRPVRGSEKDTTNNTQIYEGTNQIQRMVMARQLLKG